MDDRNVEPYDRNVILMAAFLFSSRAGVILSLCPWGRRDFLGRKNTFRLLVTDVFLR